MRAPEAAPPESDAHPGAPHPRFAQGLIGHRAAEAELLDAYRAQKLPHAWLIGGRAGIGKATLAWRLARFVLAEPDPTADSVRAAVDLAVDAQAPAVRQAMALAHPDLVVLRRSWNPHAKSLRSEIIVDDVRTALDLFHKSAGAGGWRVCIVDSADDLNRAGANALLKMIEEPPPRSLFLILAHKPGQAPATIRSRCRRLALAGLAPAQIVEIVGGLGEPWSAIAPEAVARAAGRADGSVRETLEHIDPVTAEVGALIEAMLARLPAVDFPLVHRLADAVGGRGAGAAFDGLMNALYDWLAERARTAGDGARLAPTADLWDKIRSATREAEAYNLDRRLHVLSVFAEFSAAARRL